MSDKKTIKEKFSALEGLHRVVPILLISSAAIITALLIFGGGAVGYGIKALLMGLFGYGAFAIPAAMLVHGLCYPEDLEHKSVLRRFIFSIVTLVLASCVDYAVSMLGNDPSFLPGVAFANMNQGGFIGNSIGFVLTLMFGQMGVIVLCISIFAIYLTFFYAEKAGSLGQAAIRIKGKRRSS